MHAAYQIFDNINLEKSGIGFHIFPTILIFVMQFLLASSQIGGYCNPYSANFETLCRRAY